MMMIRRMPLLLCRCRRSCRCPGNVNVEADDVDVVVMVAAAAVVEVGPRRASDGALLCISGCKNTALTSTFSRDRA